MALLQRTAALPGRAGAAPTGWPSGSALRPVDGKANLLVFAHPMCPCSRATLAELRSLLAAAGDAAPVSTRVVFFEPSQPPAGWGVGLRDAAAAIPGVRVVSDADGAEARRFGAETSGWTLLYDAGGTLRFAGGITIARGHEGDGAGRAAVLAALRDPGGGGGATAGVFGCPIRNPAAAAGPTPAGTYTNFGGTR